MAEEWLKINASQQLSSLAQAIASAHGLTLTDLGNWRINKALLHFHDDSHCEIAWNDVQAILLYNEHSGESLPVPAVATRGFNKHYHRSEYDGGWIPGMGPHDHRDNFSGGLCFSVYHPGSGLPQAPFSI